MIQSAWIIAVKEIRLLFKSTRRILLLFTTPLIMFAMIAIIVFFSGMMLPGADKPLDVTVIQADEGHDGVNWGDGFYKLLKTNNLSKNYIYNNESVDDLKNLLQTKNFSVIIYIPANFSTIINQSLSAQFYLYYDNTNLNNQGIVSNILILSQSYNQQIVYYFHGVINITKIFVIPEGVVDESGFESLIASSLTLIPLYAIIFLVVPSLSLVLISVTIEREQKTLESLILQPIERKSIVAGKLIYGSILVIFNTLVTIISIIAILILGYFLLPESLKSEILPIAQTAIETADISVWIFIIFALIGLILVSLLVITAAVLFSLMAKDEREANMVISALIIIPLISTLLIAFLPASIIDNPFQIILILLPLLGYLFAIYSSLLSGELTTIAWLSLVSQLGWTLLGIWFTGRIVESEGILEISYKKFFMFRRKR